MSKRASAIGAAVVTAFAVAAGCTVTIQPNIFVAEEDFELSQPLDDIGSMSIAWDNGTIEVRVDPAATEILITGTKRVVAESSQAANDALDDWTIELAIAESSPAQAFLAFNAPPGAGRTYDADLEVVLPPALNLAIENDNGSVKVEDNTALTNISVANGSVTVTGQQGDLTVSVENGSIGIDSLAGNVDAEAENGNLSIDADPEEGGSVKARVDVGSIELRVPAEFAASLELDTDVGIVAADLGAFTLTDLQSSLHRVTATLNGGGGELSARTDVGNVRFDNLP
ncbi:MAG: DUF4097 domain-containing protein [bacterium]|nr:DUF4097 domain-containing protein [bacterium]